MQEHEQHLLAVFLVFCFIAALGVIVVFYQFDWVITGAYTAYSPVSTTTYTQCTDYGNWILLENDAGWKRTKKDICTGVDNQFIRKAACVLKNDPTQPNYLEYTFTYTKVAYCESGNSCALDKNKAAYCPE